MKMRALMAVLFYCALVLPCANTEFVFSGSPLPSWKASVSRISITPDEPIWMAGYTGRTHAATGTLNDLWAKALALEDSVGTRALLITADLEEIPKALSDRIRNQLCLQYGLTKSQIIFNCSHTHSGPLLKEIVGFYMVDSLEIAKVNRYSDTLEWKIIQTAGAAIRSLQPANVFSKNGVVRFQLNRRTNNESGLSIQTQYNGPNDDAVPVIKIEKKSGELLAIVFGYACHNSVLNGYMWSGDYAGFAQEELERSLPGVAALFFQGAGGNQIAYPRRTVASALYHGRCLAAAVRRVLVEAMPSLSPVITSVYSEVDLPVSKAPSLKKLEETSQNDPDLFTRKWAAVLLDSVRAGQPLRSSYPYPVQVWRLGQQLIFSLGGEVVVEYALQLKQLFGQDIFVAGYCNDVMAYIPTAAIINEGGYESVSSLTSSSGCLPAPWSVMIEQMILEQCIKMAQQTSTGSIPAK